MDIESKGALMKPNHLDLPKILIVGPGRSSKDYLGKYIHENSDHTYGGSTSLYLTKYVAREFGITEEQAYSLRHQHRERWFEIGNKIRESDWGLLQKEALQRGNVIAGIRDIREVVWACIGDGRFLYDHIIWIQADVPVDPTLTFGYNDLAVMLQWKKTKLTIIENDFGDGFIQQANEFLKALL